MTTELPYYDIIGVMSGTSLDGLDLAFCRFGEDQGQLTGKILYAETISYPAEWKLRLGHAHKLSSLDFLCLHNDFGKYIGNEVLLFLEKYNLKPICISSHGHTVFHHPARGLTFQIGNGAAIAAETGIDVVCDFRTSDVTLGGEGAPLVPFGDVHLFSGYDAALNLGGFSNITIMRSGQAVAFDICPVNIILNRMAKNEGVEFDHNGKMASGGRIITNLLEKLELLDIYSETKKRSLSREWLESSVIPLINEDAYTTGDILRTLSEHIALRIAEVLNAYDIRNCLVTGGGVYNTFLVQRIQHLTQTELVIPDDNLIQFKEALIFAFLGLKRMKNEINVLSEVTHARKSSSSGIIWKS